MAPPVKRRKRRVIPTSSPNSGHDDETTVHNFKSPLSTEVYSSPSASNEATTLMASGSPDQFLTTRTEAASKPKPAFATSRSKQARGVRTGVERASNSPEKLKRITKYEEKSKSADLFTFFTKQTQRQQTAGVGAEVAPKQRLLTKCSEDSKFEDLDIISDDDYVGEGNAQVTSRVVQAARKRARGQDTFKNRKGDAPNAGQKFLKTPKLSEKSKNNHEMRPWAERFAPVSLDELAVHNKKVADVRAWLEEVMSGRMRQRLLLLKGAAGTGKTTTIQLLAKAMDCDVLEWRNPVGSLTTSEGHQSMTAQFEDFMSRGGKFGPLDIFSSDTIQPHQKLRPLDRRKRLVLIEEFPNTFTRSSTALRSFRSTIIQFLASNMPLLSIGYNNNGDIDSITPVVMIISETLLTTTSASADSFTAHRLLGPEILQHPGVRIIEFNAIAPTLLAKALGLIVQKESRKSGRRKTPGPIVLKKLGEVGDIRSAIGSLEFLCLRGDDDGDWGSKVAFGKNKNSGNDAIALTKMEEESLELITRREASLGIFHAVGKVIYNKRHETGPARSEGTDVEQLPDFMSLHSRPKRSQVSVEELIDETGTDTQTFISALHENYLLSCDASPSSFEFSTLDHVNGCIDALSDSDLLCPSWDGSFNSTGFGGGTGGRGTGGDVVRQDEIAFQVAVRGILFSLPNPVKRKAPATTGVRTGKGQDAFKMFYPTSLKLWRMKEEIESTIDLWVTSLMKGSNEYIGTISAGNKVIARPNPGLVESWKNEGSTNYLKGKETVNTNPDIAPLIYVGTSARKEMLLERLPYMVVITRTRKDSSSALAVRKMEKVTSFHGIGGQSEGTPDDDDENSVTGEDWATDKPVEVATPPTKRSAMLGRGIGSRLTMQRQQQEQKLVLSDDDIED